VPINRSTELIDAAIESMRATFYATAAILVDSTYPRCEHVAVFDIVQSTVEVSPPALAAPRLFQKVNEAIIGTGPMGWRRAQCAPRPGSDVKRLLVTGRHGFVGGTLARLVSAEPALGPWSMIDVPLALDLRDPEAAAALVKDEAPDAVIHLAAQSWVPDAFRDPGFTVQVNVLGTLNLLQALRRTGFCGRMVFVSTGDVYGSVPDNELPITEDRLPAPRNPYAVSKLAAETLCYQWSVTEGMEISVARAFNHIGPRQSERFVVSDFARQVAEIKSGKREPVVEVGDIDVTRDFTDVRDVVRAYFALLRDGKSGEVYNICSGREQSIRAVLHRLAAIAGVQISVRQDPSRLRKSEQRRVVGDPGKMQRATGWQATTELDESLAMLLHEWEREIANV
jgi:GDP-4-dehydro-6-deoxy-D-mannose reductase